MPNPLNWIIEKFGKDTSKMLIVTGVFGYIFSSAAQCLAVVNNSKISAKEKGFLLPQEVGDAIVNIATFLLITTTTKKAVGKLFKTGKFVPKNVREFLDKSPELKDKVGKLDFNIEDEFKKLGDKLPKNLESSYRTSKNYTLTISTILATVAASNIITPIIRNKMASGVQKKQIESTIGTPDGEIKNPTTPIKILNKVIYSSPTSNSMRI